MNYFINGEKIYFRALNKGDIPVWFDWFNDPIITENMNKGAFPNTGVAQEEYLSYLSRSNNDVQLAIILKENDSLIGVVGVHKLDWIHRHGDLSILIGDRTCWRKGIATEAISLIVQHAFGKLNLYKLTAGMWSSNVSCKTCFEKNGFVLEGTVRKQFYHKNSYVDEYRLGLLKEDWEAQSTQNQCMK